MPVSKAAPGEKNMVETNTLMPPTAAALMRSKSSFRQRHVLTMMPVITAGTRNNASAKKITNGLMIRMPNCMENSAMSSKTAMPAMAGAAAKVKITLAVGYGWVFFALLNTTLLEDVACTL